MRPCHAPLVKAANGKRARKNLGLATVSYLYKSDFSLSFQSKLNTPLLNSTTTSTHHTFPYNNTPTLILWVVTASTVSALAAPVVNAEAVLAKPVHRHRHRCWCCDKEGNKVYLKMASCMTVLSCT